MMNFRLGYAAVTDVDRNAFVLDAPGPTPPTLSSLPFKRLDTTSVWLPERCSMEAVGDKPRIRMLESR